MIITIGRECGCNADEIGRMLAGKYGIFCYTKAELIQLAKEKGVYEKYPFFFGEMPVDMMISPMAESLEERLRNTPQEALESVLGGEDCVIVGRAARSLSRKWTYISFRYLSISSASAVSMMCITLSLPSRITSRQIS